MEPGLGQTSQEGALSLFDGVGVVTRGDTLLALHPADASSARSRFMFQHGERVQRVVTVPEGHAFHVSLVRLVVGAYFALSGKRDTHFVAKNVDEGIALALAVRTSITPGAAQLRTDLDRLRSALSTRPHSPT
jgi:hypothetical protein